MIQTGDIPVVPMPENLDSTGFWSSIKGMGFDEAVATISNSIISFAFRLVLAIALFYIGRFLIKKIYKWVYNMMTHKHVDASLTTFVLSLIRISLYFILVITVIGILGVETSSFIAIFASAGVAVGMALSGTLQNFAGGVLILLLKPYKVGDFIEVAGYTGTVKSIQLFNTIINTIDNKAIIVPNGMLSTSTINNYSLEDYRRVDWDISLAYGTDINSAKDIIRNFLIDDKRVVNRYIEDDVAYREKIREEKSTLAKIEDEEDTKHGFFYRLFHKPKSKLKVVTDVNMEELPDVPPVKLERGPFVALKEMGDSAIVITARAWTHSSNYWGLYFDINELLYTELPKHGFSFPFPQLDVHLNPEP